MVGNWMVQAATVRSAEKRIEQYRFGTLIGLLFTLGFAIVQLFHPEFVSSWVFIVSTFVTLLNFLGEFCVRDRLKSGLYGIERSEFHEILNEVRSTKE